MLAGSPCSCARETYRLVLATEISPASDPEMASVLATANVRATVNVPAKESALACGRLHGRIDLAPPGASLHARCPSLDDDPSFACRALGRSCSRLFCVCRRLPRRSSWIGRPGASPSLRWYQLMRGSPARRVPFCRRRARLSLGKSRILTMRRRLFRPTLLPNSPGFF